MSYYISSLYYIFLLLMYNKLIVRYCNKLLKVAVFFFLFSFFSLPPFFLPFPCPLLSFSFAFFRFLKEKRYLLNHPSCYDQWSILQFVESSRNTSSAISRNEKQIVTIYRPRACTREKRESVLKTENDA